MTSPLKKPPKAPITHSPTKKLKKLARETDFRCDDRGKVTIPHKKIYGNLHIPNADCVYAPHLEEVKLNISLDRATKFEAPELIKTGGGISANSVVTLKIPKLQEVGSGFTATSARSLDVPELVRIQGNLRATQVRTLSIPKLQHVGGTIDAVSVIKFDAPKLDSVLDGLSIIKAKTIDIPEMVSIGEDFDANEAEEIRAGNLEDVKWNIHAEKATRVFLPKLKSAQMMDFSSTDPKLPSLTSCETIITKNDQFTFENWKRHQRLQKEKIKKALTPTEINL